MASSTDYWNVASQVSEELSALSNIASDAYSALESSDDPGELADALQEIQTRLDKLSGQIGSNIAPLRKTAKALDEIPGIG
jgi:GTP1/Obg family GTP-binding protein